MTNQVSDARTSFSPVFLRIVKENRKKVLNLDLRLKKLEMELEKGKGEDRVEVLERRIFLLETELVKSSLIVIVFTAMILESYIYDYAARRLTDNFVRDHLDKLDTLSKWVIVPELITGSKLSNRQNWRELMKKLIKARNSIIHHKSSQLPSSISDMNKYIEKQQVNSNLLLEAARQSDQLLILLADKIVEIDPQESMWVKAHLT